MAEEPSLSYYLPIAGGRIIGFIPFPRVLVLCEMQSVSSRIWTRIAVFISYGDNDYTTGTSTLDLLKVFLGKLWSFYLDFGSLYFDFGTLHRTSNRTLFLWVVAIFLVHHISSIIWKACSPYMEIGHEYNIMAEGSCFIYLAFGFS